MKPIQSTIISIILGALAGFTLAALVITKPVLPKITFNREPKIYSAVVVSGVSTSIPARTEIAQAPPQTISAQKGHIPLPIPSFVFAGCVLLFLSLVRLLIPQKSKNDRPSPFILPRLSIGY